jgi:hypothetical protein
MMLTDTIYSCADPEQHTTEIEQQKMTSSQQNRHRCISDGHQRTPLSAPIFALASVNYPRMRGACGVLQQWDTLVMTISTWEFCWMVLASSVGVGDPVAQTWLAHMLQTWRVKTRMRYLTKCWGGVILRRSGSCQKVQSLDPPRK